MNRLRVSPLLLLGFLCICVASLNAQDNISCDRAQQIADPADYCSVVGEFTNVNGADLPGEAIYSLPLCWSGRESESHDVWFRFTAMAKAVNILVNGSANQGTLNQPQVNLYEDNGCFGTIRPLACERDERGVGAINLFQGGLVIGASYLIRVDGSDGAVGTFQLCLNNFNPPVEPGQDFSGSSILCDKSTFTVQTVSGGGTDSDEARGTCLGGLGGDSENQSTWFSWTAANSGTLGFVISPLLEDDIDWVLFELPDGLDQGDSRVPIRCSAAYGGNAPGVVSCGSLTGMREEANDVEEGGGCIDGQDGFVSSINMVEGTSYALLVNNWDESGAGFEIDFTGTGEFLGPEPLFEPDVNLDILECDREVIFTDASVDNNTSIVSWEWNFGQGATPQFGSGQQPQSVTYESIGEKIAALTVESEKGCLVTYTLPFTIQPCCDDLVDFTLDLTPTDLGCANVPTGAIFAQGVGGNPDYLYSFDDVNYSLNPNFRDLAAGTYTIYTRDIKGCERSEMVMISEPEALTVEAGDPQTTDLGLPVEINASYNPPEYNVTLEWTPTEGITCIDPECFELSVIARGTTTYTVTATSDDGCVAQDMVTITTNANYDVYPPTAIIIESNQPESENNYFRIFAGPSAEIVEQLMVFDRWGNRMYMETDISLDSGIPDTKKGWDGRFRGKLVDTGTYSWVARVRFFDDTIQILNGDFTVMR